MPNKVVGEMRERLAEMLETTGELERKRSRLVEEMRTTMGAIKTLRDHLMARPEPGEPTVAHRAGERLARKYHLTRREVEVALLLAGGVSNVVIASALRISQHTARHHTRHVLIKLGLHSRARAGALIARELGGVGLP